MITILKNGQEFFVTEQAKETYSAIVDLIVNTESMDDKEKQYWLNILPGGDGLQDDPEMRMTDSQVDRLFEILEKERVKIEEMELRYGEEIKKLNEKHLLEFQRQKEKEEKKKAKAEEKKNKKVSKKGKKK